MYARSWRGSSPSARRGASPNPAGSTAPCPAAGGTRRGAARAAPRTLVEVLTPDFQGVKSALDLIIDAAPTVAAHNLETVERLTPRVRDRRASYGQSLAVLGHYKRGGMRTKSSIMLGLGEERK